ncbi:MAG: glycosyltransferase family 39 protein [Anaerolineae bacterium]|nr:glycosyltransferase family 39 protein [Anaerolineae bacterium]
MIAELRLSTGRRPRSIAILIVILLIATAFRVINVDNFPTPRDATPPGLEHDEVAHWLINQDILAGHHAIYFTEAYGHEALYHYIQAGVGMLLGDHALALRLPSIYFGVLLVAVGYALGRRLFGEQAGLWSAAFLAVLFWPVFYSRLALRAISLPVLSGLAAWFWWRAFPDEIPPDATSHRSTWLLTLSGLFAGLSLHTYMAARAVPIFFALYTAYLALFHRPILRRYRQGIILFWLVMIVVSAPLAVYLSGNPGSEIRIAEVDAPLRALRAGDARPVLENALRIAGMFGVTGDPLWRQNIAGRPVFDIAMAALFYAGVALSLWRWRDKRHAFILLWLAASVTPSLVTIDAPSSIRIINLLPVLMLFPLIFVHSATSLSTRWDKLSPKLITRTSAWLLGALLLWSAASTVVGLWGVWPANDEVRFVWQAALTEAGAYLDHSLETGPVAVGGWTPETMDPPTMKLTLRRDDLSLRYFDPREGVIVPVSLSGEFIRIVTPSILPLASVLDGVIPDRRVEGDFVLYEVSPDLGLAPDYAAGVDFGGQLRFLGYNLSGACVAGEVCEVITFWRVLAPADGPRRFFLHATENGEVASQDDGLGAPAEYWQAGDTVIQILTVGKATAQLRLGVYNPIDGARLATVDGVDYVTIDLP